MKAAKQAWISQSQFTPMKEHELLKEIILRIDQCIHKKQTPIVVFDLDSTLYEVQPRTLAILKEWSQLVPPSSLVDPLFMTQFRDKLHDLESKDIGYSIKETFDLLGFPETLHRKEIKNAKSYWETRFFSNEYLGHDETYTGALEWVHAIHDAGSRIVYLTGRDESRMGPGTRNRLIMDGFPLSEPQSKVVLKASADLEDFHHKVTSILALTQEGEIVASFENEPKNIVGMAQEVPGALHVFVETVCSDHEAPIANGLVRLKKFML